MGVCALMVAVLLLSALAGYPFDMIYFVFLVFYISFTFSTFNVHRRRDIERNRTGASKREREREGASKRVRKM